jgi:hypothetical protein
VRILEENIGDLKGDDLIAAFQEIGKMRKLEGSYDSKIRAGRIAIRQYLTEFALTPVTRTRVRPLSPKPQPPVDPLEERYFRTGGRQVVQRHDD